MILKTFIIIVKTESLGMLSCKIWNTTLG